MGPDHSTIASPVPPTAARWRAFADAIALALGLNLWLSLVVLPGLFEGAWSHRRGLVVAAPLLALAAGVWRRSEAMLLFGFPTTLLLPVAVAPSIVASHVYGPVHFTVVALGLVAYLFGASFFTSFSEPPAPDGARPLRSAQPPVPGRWRRRRRVYAYLTALSVAMPAILLYQIDFDSSTAEFLTKMYPGRAGAYLAVVNLVLLAFWLVVYRRVFLAVLEQHRTGDRALTDRLRSLRAEVGRPRPIFYLSVLLALVLIALLFSWR